MVHSQVKRGGADQHFEWGKKNLKNSKFLTPIKKPANKGRHGKNLRVLTKREKAYNSAFHSAHVRVENVFGHMEAKFECLRKVWREDDNQLDTVIWTQCRDAIIPTTPSLTFVFNLFDIKSYIDLTNIIFIGLKSH